ncbi:MAG: hypothetical protein E6I92_06335 [Chloroflexi bacterium]|nr:MAG: hypothetical protein E6I92_06335 [Chloroflexota bacterium]
MSAVAGQHASISVIGRARHRLRTQVTEHPALYLPIARAKRALRLDVRDLQRQVINSRTELVIEGYTRCGTTFAVYALQLSQERPVWLAHHWHAPAQLIEAAHRKIPALLVIRRPEDAILSQLVREPNVTIHDALVAYSRFYECLLPYRHSFVVGEFEQVTHEFGPVIRKLNARFGTSFAEFVHTDANVRECLELIKLRGTLSKTLFGFESGEVSREQLDREVQSVGGAKLLDAGDVWDTKDAWVPSEDRTRAKAALREQWLQQPSLAKLRERAQLVYQAHVDGR